MRAKPSLQPALHRSLVRMQKLPPGSVVLGRLDAYTHSTKREFRSYQSGEYLRKIVETVETEVVLAGCEPLTATGWRLTNPGKGLA